MEPTGACRRSCRGIRVVLVDHDAAFRHHLAATLRRDGHAVRECADVADLSGDGEEAADEVVVTEAALSAADACALAERLHAARPHVPVVIVGRPGRPPAARFDYERLHVLLHAVAGGLAD